MTANSGWSDKAKLEKFCREFKGDPKYLVPLHLLADQKYITVKKDFSSAVKHLVQAYRIGVANPRDAEVVLYRIGRIYDLKLNDHKMGMEYYREFLKKYPQSGYTPAVTRFRQQLNLQSEEKNNGQK